jgi:hypothetical protein
MPIKKSTVERKWYYRVLKVLLVLLPLLLLLLFLLNRKGIVCSVAPFVLPDLGTILLVALCVVAYYLFLKVVRWAVFYLVFGGMEDDTQPQPLIAKQRPTKTLLWVQVAIGLACAIIALLIMLGTIKVPKFTPGSSVVQPTTKTAPKCPATSAQTATPCHSSGGGVGVGGVIVHDYCKCPSDTTYSGTTDTVTPGGPYKICTCN